MNRLDAIYQDTVDLDSDCVARLAPVNYWNITLQAAKQI
jgi:hypothetical protein